MYSDRMLSSVCRSSSFSFSRALFLRSSSSLSLRSCSTSRHLIRSRGSRKKHTMNTQVHKTIVIMNMQSSGVIRVSFVESEYNRLPIKVPKIFWLVGYLEPTFFLWFYLRWSNYRSDLAIDGPTVNAEATFNEALVKRALETGSHRRYFLCLGDFFGLRLYSRETIAKP